MNETTNTATVNQVIVLLSHIKHCKRITVGTLRMGIDWDFEPALQTAKEAGLITISVDGQIEWNKKG